MAVASWCPGDSEQGLHLLVLRCDVLCSGKDECLSASPMLYFFFFSLHCVGLIVFVEQADVLASCGTPGLCLTFAREVTFPLQCAIPSCLWKGILAPFEITTERAAVCQPPPEPWSWAGVNLLEEFPMQQTGCH